MGYVRERCRCCPKSLTPTPSLHLDWTVTRRSRTQVGSILKPLQLGFNPQITPESRQQLHARLHEVVDVAVHLEFDVVELSLTTAMHDLGLKTVFDSETIEIFHGAPVRFHLNLFADATATDRPAVTDVNTYARSVALRQIVQITEFFEHRHPMEMYVVHPGLRVTDESAHLDALHESLRTLDSLFPGLPIAVENTGRQAVLSRLDSVLNALDRTRQMRFALHTGLAFHSVHADHAAFQARIDYLQRFSDQLAEIRWHNTGPGSRCSLPLHRSIEHGIDLGMIMHKIGRNPGTLHMIETVGLDPPALVREVRTLHRAFNQ